MASSRVREECNLVPDLSRSLPGSEPRRLTTLCRDLEGHSQFEHHEIELSRESRCDGHQQIVKRRQHSARVMEIVAARNAVQTMIRPCRCCYRKRERCDWTVVLCTQVCAGHVVGFEDLCCTGRHIWRGSRSCGSSGASTASTRGTRERSTCKISPVGKTATPRSWSAFLLLV